MPPLVIESVPVVSESAMPKEEVAKAWTFPVAPVGFPRMVFAPIWTSFARETPFVARSIVEFVPPTRAPRVPVKVKAADGVRVVVETF